MTPISILFKASLLLAAVAIAQAMLSRRTSAATRHLMWTLAIVGLLLLPMLAGVLPGWTAVHSPHGKRQGPRRSRSLEGLPSPFLPRRTRVPARPPSSLAPASQGRRQRPSASRGRRPWQPSMRLAYFFCWRV